MTSALLTDRYELTMLGSALRDGTANRQCVFEVFARRLPEGRRYGVVAGNGRLLEAIEDFTFDTATLAWLRDSGVVDEATAEYLDRSGSPATSTATPRVRCSSRTPRC